MLNKSEREKEGDRDTHLNNEGMDTCLSISRQTSACDSLRTEAGKEPCLPVTKSPYENKHSSSEAQNKLK